MRDYKVYCNYSLWKRIMKLLLLVKSDWLIWDLVSYPFTRPFTRKIYCFQNRFYVRPYHVCIGFFEGIFCPLSKSVRSEELKEIRCHSVNSTDSAITMCRGGLEMTNFCMDNSNISVSGLTGIGLQGRGEVTNKISRCRVAKYQPFRYN